MTTHQRPLSIASQRALELACLLRAEEGAVSRRDPDGTLVLMPERHLMAELGMTSRVQVHRALLALEALAPGAVERRPARPAVVHPEVLAAAVEAAPDGSPLCLVRWHEEEIAAREMPVPGPTMLPEGFAAAVREATREGQVRGVITDTGDIRHLQDTVIRMGIRTMSGSTYEFEPALSRARFVSGDHGPTPAMSPANSWHEFTDSSMPTVGSRVFMLWGGGRMTTLTPTVAVWAVGLVDLDDLPPVAVDLEWWDADAV